MQLSGIPVSIGIACGKAFVYKEQEARIRTSKINTDEIESEVQHFLDAQSKSIAQLETIKTQTHEKLGASQEAIFDGHILLLSDPEMEQEILKLIRDKKLSADHAVDQTIQHYIKMVKNLNDPYLRERALDFEDIGKRLIQNILQTPALDTHFMPEAGILVADDLTPSQTVQLDLSKVLGLATVFGGRTSHTSIVAQSLGIPAIVSVNKLTQKVKPGDTLILDAIHNCITINPSPSQIRHFETEQKIFHDEVREYEKLKECPACTPDNHHIELAANISTPQDTTGAQHYGADGIGLFRSEFLFLDRNHFPTEEEQFNVYKNVVEQMPEKRVVIRTMDVGGDKELSYLNAPKETNPFLGWRAIRIFLERPDIMVAQLRALMRASAFGQVAIMFPMIISVSEFAELKAVIQQLKIDFKLQKINFNPKLEVGVMIETPAAAMVADQLACLVDFFSIGTNDLTQYTLAVDRGNDKIAHLYQPLSPPVLRLIKRVVDAAHERKKWVGLCGELAGDPQATALLVGLGLDELSMTSTMIPRIKKIIRATNYGQAKKLAKQALNCTSHNDIIELIEYFHKNDA